MAYNFLSYFISQVDGVMNNIPFSTSDGKISVTVNGMQSVIDIDNGIQLQFDSLYNIIVTLPTFYEGTLLGLCGNDNGNPDDDLYLPGQSQASDNATFGDFWRVQEPYWDINPNCSSYGNACSQCSQQMKDNFGTIKYCGFLTEPNGPLSGCYPIIDPFVRFQNCKNDLCDIDSEETQHEILCQIIHSYVMACQAAGAIILPWRNETFCRKLS